MIAHLKRRLEPMRDKKRHRAWYALTNKSGAKDKDRGEVEVVLRWAFEEALERFVEEGFDEHGDECLAEPNELCVGLVQGRDLLPMDSTLLGKATTADPFVKVRLAGTADRFQVCRHVPKTLRPWWNAEFRVPLPLAAAMADGASLELVVEDYDMLSKNDFMGKALIPLAGLEDKKTRRAWYALGDEQGRQRVIRRRFDSSDKDGVVAGDDDGGGTTPSKLERTKSAGKGGLMSRLVGVSASAAVDRGEVGVVLRYVRNSALDHFDAENAHTNPGKQPNELRVALTMARGLVGVDSHLFAVPTSDPFVSLACGSLKRKSRVKKSTLDPTWNQYFSFKVPGEDEAPFDEPGAPSTIPDRLDLVVEDWDRFSSPDFMGQVAIDLAPLRDRRFRRGWYPLRGKDGNGAREARTRGRRRRGAARLKDLKKRCPRGQVEVALQWVYTPACDFCGDALDDGDRVGRALRAGAPGAAARKPNLLRVAILSGQGLRPMDRTGLFGGGGSADPVAKLACAGQTASTATRAATLAPEWHETFELPVEPDPGNQQLALVLVVEDVDKLSQNDFMGQCALKLRQLADGGRRRGWLKLLDRDFEAENDGEAPRGEVEVVAKWEYDASLDHFPDFDRWPDRRPNALRVAVIQGRELTQPRGVTGKGDRLHKDAHVSVRVADQVAFTRAAQDFPRPDQPWWNDELKLPIWKHSDKARRREWLDLEHKGKPAGALDVVVRWEFDAICDFGLHATDAGAEDTQEPNEIAPSGALKKPGRPQAIASGTVELDLGHYKPRERKFVALEPPRRARSVSVAAPPAAPAPAPAQRMGREAAALAALSDAELRTAATRPRVIACALLELLATPAPDGAAAWTLSGANAILGVLAAGDAVSFKLPDRSVQVGTISRVHKDGNGAGGKKRRRPLPVRGGEWHERYVVRRDDGTVEILVRARRQSLAHFARGGRGALYLGRDADGNVDAAAAEAVSQRRRSSSVVVAEPGFNVQLTSFELAADLARPLPTMEPVARIRGYVHAYRSPEVKSVCARLASARSDDDAAAQRGDGGESGVWALGALALNLFEPRRLRYAAAPPPRGRRSPTATTTTTRRRTTTGAATTPDEVARLADVSGENAAEAFRAYCAKGDKGASMGQAARDWLRSAAEKRAQRGRGAAAARRGALPRRRLRQDATGPVPAPRVPSERLNDDAPPQVATRCATSAARGSSSSRGPVPPAAALDPQIFGDDASFVSAQSGGSVDAASPAVAAARAHRARRRRVRARPLPAESQVAHEWAIEALRKTRGAEHHPMDVALLARMGMDAMKSDEMLKGFQIMDQTRRAPGDANHVKAALAEDERKALIDQYEDRDAPEQHTRGVARARVGSARLWPNVPSTQVLALPRGAASAVARHKAMRKYGRRDRELPGGGRRGDDDDSFSGSEAFTSSGGEEGDDANDLGGEHRSQARRNRPELYRALDETVAGTLGFDLMCLDYILPTPNLDLAASIDVPEPVPEKKARDGSESGSDIEDKPLYLLPENQHHPPEFDRRGAGGSCATSAMDRLSDDTVITIFKYLKPRELESVASASRALSERDAVWHELARELVGTRGGGGRPSGRSSARLRLTGKQTYAKVHALRLSNSEEARNKFDGAKKVSLAALRSVLKDWSPLDLNARGSSGCSFLHSIISDARLTKGQTLQCARELVDRWGADVNVSNDLDLSPLHSAAALGDLRTVEFLVERGASLASARTNGRRRAVRPAQRRWRRWAETFGNADVVDFIAAREPAAAVAGEPAATAAASRRRRPRKKRRKRRELFCYPTCRYGRENAGNMIHCEGGCERWFHLECVNMSDEAFKTMVRDEDAKFACPECETGVAFRYEPLEADALGGWLDAETG
ncbi:C2 domain-containing protein [Aureococcus anophagefferens]|nr:C2 domain-containing protein [Aureococcus anophagefferens]